MKKNFVFLLAGLSVCALLMSGCNASDQVKSAVEHSYEVVVKGQEVLGVVSDKLAGSVVWNDVGVYMTSLRIALSSMEKALERIAPWVDAELYEKKITSSITGLTALEELNTAVQKLDESVNSK